MSNYPQLKREEITLKQFGYIAESLGYQEKQANSKYILLNNGSKEIYINLSKNKQFYRYANQHDYTENGDIFQFVMNENSCGFINAKDYVCNQLDIYAISPQREKHEKQPAKQPKSTEHFVNILLRQRLASESQYLINERKISIETLDNAVLARTDTYKAMFFHQNAKGEICGYEYRLNREPRHDKDRVKGYAEGGTFGLFSANYGDESIQDKLIIVESAINALSLIDIFKLQNKQCNAMICSTGGNLSDYQISIIIDLAKNFECTYLAQDNDPQPATGEKVKGEKQADRLAKALDYIGAKYQRMRPKVIDSDWNDKLKAMIK